MFLSDLSNAWLLWKLSLELWLAKADECATAPSGTFKETENPKLSGDPWVFLIPHFRVFSLLLKLQQ